MSQSATYRYSSLITYICLIMLLLIPGEAVVAAGGEEVGVSGSSTKYPVSINSKIADKDTPLVLTGTAQRKKAMFKVYTIGSYVEQGVAINSAAELAQKDCAKQLHLVMERGVSGKTMAEAFIEGIDLNYPDTNFAEQKKALLEFMTDHSLNTGDQVWLTHVPGVGFHCTLPGNKEVLIKDIPFSVAIWQIYLGDNNIGDAVKSGMTSRLPVSGEK